MKRKPQSETRFIQLPWADETGDDVDAIVKAMANQAFPVEASPSEAIESALRIFKENIKTLKLKHIKALHYAYMERRSLDNDTRNIYLSETAWELISDIADYMLKEDILVKYVHYGKWINKKRIILMAVAHVAESVTN